MNAEVILVFPCWWTIRADGHLYYVVRPSRWLTTCGWSTGKIREWNGRPKTTVCRECGTGLLRSTLKLQGFLMRLPTKTRYGRVDLTKSTQKHKSH